MFREPISELSAQLRNSAGAELVEEWEATEHETEQGRLRSRPLATLWEQAMHRGDRVVASGSFGVCAGTVEYVGKDYAVVAASDMTWDVRLRSASLVVRRSSQGGHTATGGSRTLRARLAEYEATGENVEVHTERTVTSGAIRVAASDHILMESDVEIGIPLDVIVAVSRPKKTGENLQ